jgi:hypothetical protein
VMGFARAQPIQRARVHSTQLTGVELGGCRLRPHSDNATNPEAFSMERALNELTMRVPKDHVRGSRSVNVVPDFWSEVTSISPPWASTINLAM